MFILFPYRCNLWLGNLHHNISEYIRGENPVSAGKALAQVYVINDILAVLQGNDDNHIRKAYKIS